MCCDPSEVRRSAACREGVAVCCEAGRLPRRFRSSAEEAQRLQEYKAELEREIAGVDERIREIKGK